MTETIDHSYSERGVRGFGFHPIPCCDRPRILHPSECKDCGQLFRPEGAFVGGLDKILCVPCIGAALARITS